MAQTRAQKAAEKAAAKKAARELNTSAKTNAAADTAPIAAPTTKDTTKTAGANQSVVFVVSKITRGLYLDIFNPIVQKVPRRGGGFDEVTTQMRMPERIRIKPAVMGFGLIPNYPIIDGFSITRDVPAAHWRKWVEQNSNYEPYTMGILRAFDTEAEAIAYAKEHRELRTGLEPLNQDGDPRVATSMNSNVGDVDIDDETPRPKQPK